MANIIDGKTIAATIREEIQTQVAQLKSNHSIVPGLAVVLVGEDSASRTYVRNKEKACEKVGVNAVLHEYPDGIEERDLLGLIDDLNTDPSTHAILVQLPLPKNIDPQRVLNAISPAKDVDGFHPTSIGKLVAGLPGPRPCTPAGLIELLDRSKIEIAGKEAVIVGRSNIVGKPAAFLLLERHATVTICHSRTPDLAAKIRTADIVVAAVGRPQMITGDWLKTGSTILDVGINRDSNGKLVGDVDFESAKKVASAITPVPGGVGPMTIAMLLRNTCELATATLSTQDDDKQRQEHLS